MSQNVVSPPIFIGATEIATLCACSRDVAYRWIRECNKELEALGKLTLSGRTNRKYFMQKIDIETA